MSHPIRAFLVLPVALAALAVAPAVHAADPSVGECLAATESALKLRSDHKLRGARAQLLVCSATACPAEIRDECMHRIDEVNSALPTIVFTVKTAAGQELAAVKVTMDGEVVVDHLDGSALTLDPGDHQFTFETVGQPPVSETIILHEGEKARREMVVVGPPVPLPPIATPAPVLPTPPTHGTAAPATDSGSGLRTLGEVVGIVGAVGVGVGAVSGVLASASWNQAKQECPSFTGCSGQAMQDNRSASTAATVSTVGFIAGGVLLATGLTLYLTAPRASAPGVGLQVAPGGFLVGGWF